MPSENLTVAKFLNILAWVVLGLGLAAVAVSFFFLNRFTWNTVIPLVGAAGGVILAFIVLGVLARILRTVTYHYSMAWEQFEQISGDIDMLDGEKDNTNQKCRFCGAVLTPGQAECPQCGKPPQK